MKVYLAKGKAELSKNFSRPRVKTFTEPRDPEEISKIHNFFIFASLKNLGPENLTPSLSSTSSNLNRNVVV